METSLVKTETSLEVKRLFSAPVDQVYQAWIEPKMLDQWFHPGPDMHSKSTVDFRVGGRYVIEMHGERGVFTVAGEYQEIIPNEKLVFTWQWQGEEEYEITLVTLSFKATNSQETEVTLLHERFGTTEERDSHGDGWIGTYEQLAAALARGPLLEI